MVRPIAVSKILVVVSVALFLLALVSAVQVRGVTTYNVNVGGEYAGSPLAKGGVVWYNGYDPASIIIQPGDTIVFDLVGGVHTVTSTSVNGDGSFLFDSSPAFPVEAALADMGPGLLLPPGSVFELDTSALPLGTYRYLCKIHPGMQGNLTVIAGFPTSAIVNVVAGWGDHVYAVQAFAPENLVVERGTIVRWTLINPLEPHTITGINETSDLAWDSSPDFNPPGPPPVMLPGDSFSFTFASPGTYAYFCKLHAYMIGESWVGMTGIVHVVPFTTLEAVAPLTSSISTAGYLGLGLSILALAVALFALARGRGMGGGPGPKE